jgi:hypothetical protein
MHANKGLADICVGWAESDIFGRNPTFFGVLQFLYFCWVSLCSAQPTNFKRFLRLAFRSRYLIEIFIPACWLDSKGFAKKYLLHHNLLWMYYWISFIAKSSGVKKQGVNNEDCI